MCAFVCVCVNVLYPLFLPQTVRDWTALPVKETARRIVLGKVSSEIVCYLPHVVYSLAQSTQPCWAGVDQLSTVLLLNTGTPLVWRH